MARQWWRASDDRPHASAMIRCPCDLAPSAIISNAPRMRPEQKRESRATLNRLRWSRSYRAEAISASTRRSASPLRLVPRQAAMGSALAFDEVQTATSITQTRRRANAAADPEVYSGACPRLPALTI